MIVLCGCAPKRMMVDFTGFEKTYAETSNRELLLNLARLQNHEPTYFFKLGQITSAYRMQAAVTGNVALTPQGTVPGGSLVTGGGNPGVIFENDPTFQFIPVNDDTNAQLLLRPIPPETFYILYSQGWRLDQLFRLLVDRIEIARPSPGGGCEVQTIRNLPPPFYPNSNPTPENAYAQDQYELSSYVTFLRVSALMYSLQKHGMLLLRGNYTFRPYGDADSGITDDSQNSTAPPAQNGADHGPAGKSGNAPQAKDQNDAVGKDNVWKKTGNKWYLGHYEFVPTFRLNPLKTDGTPDEATIHNVLLQDVPQLGEGHALEQALQILVAGFSIEGDTNSQEFQANTSLCSASGISSRLYMRSMIGIMSAAAQEQLPFDKLANIDPVLPSDPYFKPQGPTTTLRFSEAVPLIEQQPLLRINWSSGGPEPASPVIRVTYRESEFIVADETTPRSPANAYWNNDMFRLIQNLTSQVTVDISKFPLPQILQLHTD